MYAEGRNSGESEGSLPCRVLDSNSNSFTQGILDGRDRNATHEKGQPTPGTELSNISGWQEDIRGQCWERQGLVVGGEDTGFFLSDSAQKGDQPVSVVCNFPDYAVHTY